MNLGIRYIKKSVYSGLLFIGVLISCVKEPIGPVVSGDKEAALVTFSLSLPSNSIPSTRALSTNDEDAVENIQILAFQNNKYIYTAYCNSIVNNRFTVSLRTGTYDLVVLANSLDAVSGLSLVSGTTNQSDVLDALVKSTTAGTGWISNPSDANYQKIPMSSGVLSKTIDDSSTGTTTSLALYRMLAKINVEVMPTAQAAFKLKSVRLYNYNTNGRVFPIINTDGTITQTNLPASPGTIGYSDPALRYTEITDGKACRGVIYTFETAKGSKASSSFATNPCIVIGGSYNGGATTYYRIDFAVKENNADTYLPLLRNHKYDVQITNVNGPGFSDETEAFNSLPINIEKEILVVNESLTDITYDGQYMLAFGENDIVLTKELTRSGIEIASSYDYNSSAADFFRWKATVTQGATWLKIYPESSALATAIMTYTADENKSGSSRKAVITVTSGRITKTITVTQGVNAHSAAVSNPSNCYMVQPGSAVKIPVSRANEGIAGSVAGSDLLDGGLMWTDCSKGLSINSVVHRILRSGTGQDGHLIVLPGKTAGNAVIALKTSADGYQNVKWSWHIWNTDYDPNTKNNGTTHAYTGTAFSSGGSLYGKTLMDRDLGATWTAKDGLPIASVMSTGGVSNATAVKAYGLLYQWGRKDPFTPSNGGSSTAVTIYGPDGVVLTENGTGVVKATVSEANNLTNSIQNPMTFYYSTNIYDWYSNVSSNDQLWNSASGKKTVLDPCPEGWRVPAGGNDAANPWTDFNTETNCPWYVSGVQGSTSGITSGRLYTGNGTENYAWYPAGGYRNHSGGFFFVGNFGRLWTTAVLSSGGYSCFVSITPNASVSFATGGIYRSSGHTVRCVRE